MHIIIIMSNIECDAKTFHTVYLFNYIVLFFIMSKLQFVIKKSVLAATLLICKTILQLKDFVTEKCFIVI